MRGGRCIRLLALGLLVQLAALTGLAQAQTQEIKSSFPRIDTQSYGDFAFRDTNFSRGGYHAITGWWETRFILRLKEKVENYRYLVFEPYVKLTLATSEKQFAWENNLVYGLGVENRFLSAWEGKLKDSQEKKDLTYRLKDLASRLRLYAEYLDMAPVKDYSDAWVPQHDVRVGIDLWKEWNIPPDRESYGGSPLWGELWFNAGWRKTNFNLPDYKTHNNGLMARLGLRQEKPFVHDASRMETLVLPYLMLETGYTGKDYFWENRLNVGGGLRLMFTLPSPICCQETGDAAKKPAAFKPIIVRLYAEALHTVDHYRGTTDPDTPENDFRVGVNFSYNLF